MGKPPQLSKSISEFHKLRGWPKPVHPLLSVVRSGDINTAPRTEPIALINNFYTIALKRDFKAKMRYGQQEADFDEGILFFMAPGQVFSIEVDADFRHTGFTVLVHPDFIWNTSLAKSVRKYAFFGYAVKEALYWSEKEENTIAAIIENIETESKSNLDKFSQDLIIAQLEMLLTYANRFYHRQFLTRKTTNHQILERLEQLLEEYFKEEILWQQGLPTVQYISEQLHVSPNYLSGLLKVLTGQSTQQHIHDKLIEKAKEKLAGTALSIGEIAYSLGFGHPQSFSKMFKTKTNCSPLEFRQSFQ